MTRINAVEFFGWSDRFDYLVTRNLAHIRSNWELTWNHYDASYVAEDDSYAEAVNQLLHELSSVSPPSKYHDHEDRLAEYLQRISNWNLRKVNGRWEGLPYELLLEQGGLGDVDQEDLILAAAGRIRAAIEFGQGHFDDMEESHRHVLSVVITTILYYRSDSLR